MGLNLITRRTASSRLTDAVQRVTFKVLLAATMMLTACGSEEAPPFEPERLRGKYTFEEPPRTHEADPGTTPLAVAISLARRGELVASLRFKEGGEGKLALGWSLQEGWAQSQKLHRIAHPEDTAATLNLWEGYEAGDSIRWESRGDTLRVQVAGQWETLGQVTGWEFFSNDEEYYKLHLQWIEEGDTLRFTLVRG